MDYLVKFYSQEFSSSDGNLKKAYLTACKWVSNNIIAENKEGFDKIVWKMKKLSLTTIELELYFKLEVEQEKKKFCKKCREFHNSFYINTRYNCNSCNFKGFEMHMKEKEKIAKYYFKEKLLE